MMCAICLGVILLLIDYGSEIRSRRAPSLSSLFFHISVAHEVESFLDEFLGKPISGSDLLVHRS